MPVESKPIFRPDVIRLPILGFTLPEHIARRRQNLQKWSDIISSGSIDEHKEQEVLGDFLNDVFCELLGYCRAVDNPKRYTISREKHVQANGKFADAVLGEFEPEGKRYVAALEGKGPKDPLDRPFAGRKVSAVDQAFDYAINLRCNWIIVTNIRQTRLYYKGTDKQTFERFDTESLAQEDRQLRKFVFLLHASRMVPLHGPSHLDTLFQESEKVGRDLTQQFYGHYSFARKSALSRLRWANPDVEPRLILGCSQKLLDRILFIAFCEDRGLLPPETIKGAFSYRDPYNPRPLWENFRGMFRAINVGNADLNIHRYNGGLFADDPVLDGLAIPDEVFRHFRDLAEYDFRPPAVVADSDVVSESRLIDVEILGHIFEQSIDDLEKLQGELAEPIEMRAETEETTQKPKASRRKVEGAFYTPAYITRYIVEQALGGVLRDRFESLRRSKAEKAKATIQRVFDDPRAYDLESLKAAPRTALLTFWLDWQQELGSIRVLDPACGSGAFLIEAFDQLHTEYERTNERVRELRGFAELFDLDRKILQDNLYGVDLNDEAVHIAKLSLWIKTAARGKELTSLDHRLRVGNSIVADRAIDPRAFDWRAEFPEVFNSETGINGFDVVIGNPPYIRQEWLSPIKPYLKARYAAYHGMADLYVYFYELGLSLLRPGGRLSYVVTNKWMKAGYGEPLRTLFADKGWVESVVDFGHAKQIFKDADVFPSIIVVRRPNGVGAPENVRVCSIPREQVRVDDLGIQIDQKGFVVARRRLANGAWQLEGEETNALLARLRASASTLSDYANVNPLYGIKTGLNVAYLIDSRKRTELVGRDASCGALIRPYVRGQDLERWTPSASGLYMIALKSSGDHKWPWANAGDDAERIFENTFPSLFSHFEGHREKLNRRSDQGKFWWELRSCAYWELFDKPKIMYQDIAWEPRFCVDVDRTLSNDTVFFIPSGDAWLLAVLNAPVSWWIAWRIVYHGKDEALRLKTIFMRDIPIPLPTPEKLETCANLVSRLMAIVERQRGTMRAMHDWLKVEYEIAEPSPRLRSLFELDSELFVDEVRKARGMKRSLSLAALQNLRGEHARTILPAQAINNESLLVERMVSDLVNEAYRLTPDEVQLMWATAPPRMPIARP